MFKKLFILSILLSSALMTGCASVPMASAERDAQLKQFNAPSEDMAALYIYRNSFVGKALKKTLYVDNVLLGETANKVYFYKVITPGSHTLSTESEFSDNAITFEAEAGKNYFARQFIKMGVFVGGAGVEMVEEAEGKKQVLQCRLAEDGITPN